jgi:O-antigen/teichoic acid export membrane protein
VRLLLLLSLPLTAFVLALGPAVLLLVYGSDYAETEPVLRIMMLAFPLVPLVNLSGALLDGLRLVRIQLVVAAVAAAVNLTLDVLLIPGGAARGAALANAVAQLVASVPLAWYAARVVGGVQLHLGSLLRAVLASAAGGLAAWGALVAAESALGSFAGVALGALAGLAVFTAVAAAIKIVAPEDAEWLQNALGSRLGPPVRHLIGWWS